VAAGVINSVTLLTELKLYLNDVDGDLITDAQYEEFIFAHFVSGDEQDFTFDKASTGIYVHRAGGLMLYAADFTPEDDNVYTLNPSGSIKVTTGTHSTTQITVTGVRVDWDELRVSCLEFLATHRAREVAQALGDGNYDPGIVRTALLEQAAVIRGVTS
jgi:hypothetical protein